MATNGRLAAIVIALAMGVCGDATAQSLLERLERRLNDAGVALPAQAPANRVEPADEAAPETAPPGYLGLTADTKDGGVEVISVRAGGPADAAGVKPGDRIVSVGGVELATLDDMGAIVDKLPAGSRIDLVVDRGGRERKVAITLAAREGAAAEPLPRPRDEEPLPEERALEQPTASLGVRAVPVTPDLQRRYGLVARRGAVIENVQAGSPAERYGLPVGAAIVAVDGARVDTPDDLAGIITTARPGDTIEISYYLRDQVYRKKVRLVPASNLAAPAPREDRPLLRRLERAIDPGRDEPEGGALAQLQAQVDEMQARIDALEERLRRLEGKPAADEDDERPTRREPALDPPLKPLEP